MRISTWGAVALALVLSAGVAGAQSRRGGMGGGRGPQPSATQTSPPPPAGGPSTLKGAPGTYRPQPLNLHKEALGTAGFAAAARARMRNGDCAGALDTFDLALQSSNDPTINRDRGLCHERLGDVYPAIDDYRVYVTAEPDAADAEGIRQRLARLEMDVLKHSSAPTDNPDDPSASGGAGPGGGSSSSAGSASVSGGSGGVSVSVDGAGQKRDAIEDVEHDHDELSSPMRAGTGFGLAPFFAEHKWFGSGASFGDSATWSESVGAHLRYSIGPRSAFFLEAGYETFNSTDLAVVSGLTSQLAYELRTPLDPLYTNQLLLAVGLGYEYLSTRPKDASLSGVSGGVFVPRVRGGWRHMLSTSVALDLALDFGITSKALAQGNSFASGTSDPVELLALDVALVWGL